MPACFLPETHPLAPAIRQAHGLQSTKLKTMSEECPELVEG